MVVIPQFIQQVRQLRRNQHMLRGQLHALQESKLRQLLRHVLVASPFYQRHYGQHGIRLQHVDGISIKDLPPVDKKLLMDNFDDVVCDRRLKRAAIDRFLLEPLVSGKQFLGEFTVVHTSGSTGAPGVFVYGPREVTTVAALMMTRVRRFQLQPRRIRMMTVSAVEGRYAGVAVSQHAPVFLYASARCSVNLPLVEIAARVQAFRPEILAGYPSVLAQLAGEQKAGRLRIAPRTVITSGEPLTAAARQALQEGFGLPPIDLLASSESLVMGATCPGHEHLHLFEDFHIFEVSDADAGVVRSRDEDEQTLMTSLYNYTLPLIRYRMSDRYVLRDEPCPCGCAMTAIKQVAGRSEEYLWFDKRSGEREFIHPLSFVELYAPGLERTRIVQKSRTEFMIEVQGQGHDEIERVLKKQIGIVLDTKGLAESVRFSVCFRDHIPPLSKAGKHQLVVPIH
ncbi:MAG: hypothetical protein NTY08_14010 [Proteobacteria bacterium]|nr:hypothetical protein [Pseudomonadota bacterium]